MTDKPRGKCGRKPLEINWGHVKRLAEIQCSRGEIVHFLDVSDPGLDNACRRDHNTTLADLLKRWREGGRATLRRSQWQLSEKNAAMAIFLGKQYLGQKDVPISEAEFNGSLADLLDKLRRVDQDGMNLKEKEQSAEPDAISEEQEKDAEEPEGPEEETPGPREFVSCL